MGEWKWVPGWGSRRITSQPPSPLQVPLHNRCEALEPERPANYEADKGSCTGSVPDIMTVFIEEKRRVIVIGDFLLRGTEGLIC